MDLKDLGTFFPYGVEILEVLGSGPRYGVARWGQVGRRQRVRPRYALDWLLSWGETSFVYLEDLQKFLGKW